MWKCVSWTGTNIGHIGNMLSILIFFVYSSIIAIILPYLGSAILSGFAIALFTSDNFQAIGAAVGILFVHDLDEKVFASMNVFRGRTGARCWKLSSVLLWIGVSFTVAFAFACHFHEGLYFGVCRLDQFECGMIHVICK